MTLAPDAVETAVRAAQGGLRAFCKAVDPGYMESPHADKVIDLLEAMQRRDIRRAIINLPPRHSKTYHVSERFPAWWLGRAPSEHVIMTSYASDLARASSRRVRGLLNDQRYPFATRLRYDAKAVGLWETEQGGGLLAAGVGGGITGFGAHLFNIDDPFKDRQEADSEVIRDTVWSWYQDVARTRLQPGGCILLTQTRWHSDDLTGRLLNSAGQSDWTHLRLPAIAEPFDPLGRREGEALWPEQFPLEELPSVERGEMSARGFAALYQQRPAPAEGGMFKRAWMRRHWPSLPPDRVDETGKPSTRPWAVIQAVDTAWDEGVGHDYSVIATWGDDGIDFYLLNVWRERVEYPDLKKAIREQWGSQRWKPRVIYVEDAANGRPLVQELKRTGLPVVSVKPEGSKIARADAVTPWFESFHVLLPPSAPWVDEWVEEHAGFPNAVNDDQVDTTSLALGELAKRRGKREPKPVDIDYRGGQDAALQGRKLSPRRRKKLREMMGVGTGMERVR